MVAVCPTRMWFSCVSLNSAVIQTNYGELDVTAGNVPRHVLR